MQRPGRRRRDSDGAQDGDSAERSIPDDLLTDVIESTATQVAVIGPDGTVITGASTGLGLAMAKEFAASGASVALLARKQDALAAARAEVQKAAAKSNVRSAVPAAEAFYQADQLSGGGAKTASSYTGITGAELRVSRLAEASAWGAAMNGFLALGLKPRPAVGARIFRPKMDPDRVRQLRAGWAAAVQRVL